MKKQLLVLSALCVILTSCGTPVKELKQEDMGYSIEVPEAWELTVNQKQTTWSFGTTETTYYQVDELDLFAITEFTSDEWASVEAGDGPMPTVIKENDDFVWTYSITQDPAGLEEYMKEVPKIVDSLKTL